MLHATAVAIKGEGVLLTGASGSGKSDLALRLIDRGATLVSDDIVLVEVADPLPLLRTAPNIAGMIEMHGVGIMKMPFADRVPLCLTVDLDAEAERMPLPATTAIAGYAVAALRLSAFEASAPIKIERALAAAKDLL